jgi:nucleoside-diphosphate-sugar epimerase
VFRPKNSIKSNNLVQVFNMRVFVTGATGFIGSPLVRELLDAGHQVLGLARSDASAEALKALGAEVHRGTLDDLDSLRSGAAASDGVIHTAFIHDFSKYLEACEVDRRAVAAMLDVLVGTGRPFVTTSGTPTLPYGKLATEETEPQRGTLRALRAQADALVMSYASRGVRVSVIRLPPSVHGDGDHGFVPILINAARKNGVSIYVGDGTNRWPAVHKLDAAHLYRLALEKAPPGSWLHGVAEEGVQAREIAGVIARRLNVPTVSKSIEEATQSIELAFVGAFLSVDNPTSSALTRQRLGWEPKQIGLLADIDRDEYFKT